MKKRKVTGVSLIELMITLAIIAIGATLVAPSFMSTIQRNQTVSQINSFVGSLNLARSEAIKRNARVSLCPSANGVSCGGAGYESGWLIFAENANFGIYDPGEELIKAREALSRNYTLRGSVNYANSISFMPSAQASAAGNFELCYIGGGKESADVFRSRLVDVMISGRVRLNEDGAVNCN